MMKRTCCLLVLLAMLLAACDMGSGQRPASPNGTSMPFLPQAQQTLTATSKAPQTCLPTRPDGEGPYYKPNAPVRSSVGKGHVLRGVVKSSANCAAIPGAKLEFWQVGPSGEYDDDHRATILADSSGAYSFESNFPPPYSGRPSHIHVRTSADGYQMLITQHYPPNGETEATFDLVLMPEVRQP